MNDQVNIGSAAFLIGTCEDAVLECLPSCQDAGNPAKYAPFTDSEHVAAMRRQNYHLPK